MMEGLQGLAMTNFSVEISHIASLYIQPDNITFCNNMCFLGLSHSNTEYSDYFDMNILHA